MIWTRHQSVIVVIANIQEITEEINRVYESHI
jgi:hypothetical protein